MAAKDDPITRPDSPIALTPQIPKDAWRPCRPALTSTPAARVLIDQAVCLDPVAAYEPSRMLYCQVLDQFHVATSARYQPVPHADAAGHTTHTTFCNIYVQDVSAAMGVPLPLRLADDMLGFLLADAVPHWHVGIQHDVIQAAQRGYPALVGWVNPSGGPGHVAMVRPESSLAASTTGATAGIVCIAQAGATCFSMGPLAQGFSTQRLPLIWAWAD